MHLQEYSLVFLEKMGLVFGFVFEVGLVFRLSVWVGIVFGDFWLKAEFFWHCDEEE